MATETTEPKAGVTMDTIVSLSKRRGIVYPNSEIYGGLASTWDYGPVGVEMFRNVKNAWWRSMVQEREDVVGLDGSILMSPKVWEATGHVQNFTDPLVDCKNCKMRWRLDKLEKPECPNCGGELTAPRQFNLMFKTFMGPVEEDAAIVYLRPETAQSIFVNFKNVLESSRKKLPFGIAQIGKSFRNEITPGNFIFRTREFEQMEMEYFIYPGTDEEWYSRWIEERMNWYLRFGMKREHLRVRPHEQSELAFYSKGTSDIEYLFPWGWDELEGIASRTNYDLTRHSEYSGQELTYFDEETQQHIIPHVVEPAAGANRCMLAFLIDSYTEEQVKKEKRVVLKLHPDLAPFKVAVLPLLRNRPEIVTLAKQIAADLRPNLMIQYDDTGSIGRLYRRQDEIGTLFCVTVDVQSLDDNQVTIRDRDSMEQVRVPISDLLPTVLSKMSDMRAAYDHRAKA